MVGIWSPYSLTLSNSVLLEYTVRMICPIAVGVTCGIGGVGCVKVS